MGIPLGNQSFLLLPKGAQAVASQRLQVKLAGDLVERRATDVWPRSLEVGLRGSDICAKVLGRSLAWEPMVCWGSVSCCGGPEGAEGYSLLTVYSEEGPRDPQRPSDWGLQGARVGPCVLGRASQPGSQIGWNKEHLGTTCLGKDLLCY